MGRTHGGAEAGGNAPERHGGGRIQRPRVGRPPAGALTAAGARVGPAGTRGPAPAQHCKRGGETGWCSVAPGGGDVCGKDTQSEGEQPGRAFVKGRAEGFPVCPGLRERPGEPKGRPARPARRGPTLLGATAARRDGWDRPVGALAVHHMPWPTDMQSRWGRHRAPPQASCEP